METIGGALLLIAAAVAIIAVTFVCVAVAGWHLFYYRLRVKKPIQATMAVAVAAVWMLGAIFGVA